jgi:hypothetical protein
MIALSLSFTAGQAAAQQARPMQAHRAAVRHPHAAPVLSPARAERLAERTGRRVTVPALTTPTSATTVSPGGTFTVTESLVPVRAWRGGRWRALNPVLHSNPDGTISPAVTTTRLVLSGGGRTPLAVMSTGPRSLSLSWPGPLPAPSLSGATATYRNVLPGADLVVTADTQGGFSDVLVVTSAKAAGNPALRAVHLTIASHGLVLSASKAGNITAAAGRTAPALYTTAAPLVWDSSRPPDGATLPGPRGIRVSKPAGQPAYSTVTAPGAGARVARVPLALSGRTLTLAPPARALTGKGVVYPVYIDPTWYSVGASASEWTQVDSGFPTTSFWRESSDLQVGDCPSSITPPSQACNGMGVARSFFQMPIPSALTGTTVVNSANLYMTEVWSPSCTKEAVQLGATGSINSGTTWNNQPSWSFRASQDAAFGYPGCGYYKNDIAWDVTSTIASDAGKYTNQTFGLRAGDESNQLAWKQFWSGSSNITMSVTYNDPPNAPYGRATSPGGSCQFSASTEPTIGNDDVTFSATVSDNDTDNQLTTRFVILNSAGGTVYDSKTAGTSVVTGNKTSARLTLTRSVMQGLSPGGSTAAFTYHWYAITTDNNNLTGPAPVGNCYFKYNPLGPSAPVVTVPASGQLGQGVAAAFTAPSGCSASGSPCPVSYTYQLGASAPVSVTADSAGDWSGSITVNQVGPIELTVYGVATGGNIGEAATASLVGTKPATPYADAYFSGGTYPDLLTLGTGNKPSLWLSRGDGNGSVGPATDIGSLGTGLNPGTDGPGDWTGATVLHGDFTGDGVQDVMAYYPQTGNGEIIAGNGNSSPLVPSSGAVSTAQSGLMASAIGDTPSPVLVGAGNASEIGTGTDDLIGISGDSVNGYELDLYTNGLCAGCAFGGGYEWNQTLATQAPDGSADWQNYTLATAQPGGNASAVVLFALDKSTGALYESTNPGQSATSIVGTGNWAQITVPWGTSPPALVSGDVNRAGATELWALSGGTPTPYVLNGSTLTKEAPGGSPLNAPANDWALTDGSPLAQTASATAATDSITGNTASLNGGVSWGEDDYFSTDATLDGQSGYITPPSGTIPSTDTTPSISVWFKTTTADGVLVSAQGQALSAGGTIAGGYDPVMYIGTDGRLHAEWWQGGLATIASGSPVDDGLWHHAVLTATGNTQSLYVDGQLAATLNGAVSLTGMANLDFGAGYLGGNWPDNVHHEQNGNTGYLDYFNGQLADINVSSAPAQSGGYYGITAKGNIYNEAGAAWYGSQANNITNAAGLALTPDGAGYWQVTATGTVYAYGDATTGTSVPGPACPIKGAVGDPAGGYLAYTACGNIYNEAGAAWYGSEAGKITNAAGLAVTPDGAGYWLITATGTVYAFGDAATGTSISPACSITGAVGDPAGGYWAYTACGNIYNEAGAPWYGSDAGNITNGAGLATTSDGGGYWLLTSAGTVYAYGDATGGTSVTSANTITGATGSPAG